MEIGFDSRSQITDPGDCRNRVATIARIGHFLSVWFIRSNRVEQEASRGFLLSEVSMTSNQLLKLLDEAAEAGRNLASNINNDCVIPDYLFEEQKESFFDEFVATRQRMYKQLEAA
jgi:hypothetical protein